MATELKYCPVQTALQPISRFLKLTGVPVNGEARYKIYSWFWLVLCLQGEIYTSVKRVKMVDIFSASNSELTEQFNKNFFLLSNLFFDTSSHFYLVFTLSSTLRAFSNRVTEIDEKLKRPCVYRIQRISQTGVAYLVFTVSHF